MQYKILSDDHHHHDDNLDDHHHHDYNHVQHDDHHYLDQPDHHLGYDADFHDDLMKILRVMIVIKFDDNSGYDDRHNMMIVLEYDKHLQHW